MNYTMAFLGVNDMFANGVDEFNTNVWVEDENERAILLDCGMDIKASTKRGGKKIEDLEAVYISNLHSDHCGGISWVGFYELFKLGRKIDLFIEIDLIDKLWEQLYPSMGRVNGNVMILHDYFNVIPIKSDMFPYFDWNGVEFTVIPVPHMKLWFKHETLWPHNKATWLYSYGLSFGNDICKYWLTTDTCIGNFAKEKHWWDYDENDGFFKDYVHYYYEHDTIFHDCCINTSTIAIDRLAHSEYNNLAKFPEEIKNKVWLVYHPTTSINMLDMAEEDGFLGFMKRSKTFKF